MPSPISTPFTPFIPIIALDKVASSLLYSTSPSPAGAFLMIVKTLAPRLSFEFLVFNISSLALSSVDSSAQKISLEFANSKSILSAFISPICLTQLWISISNSLKSNPANAPPATLATLSLALLLPPPL